MSNILFSWINRCDSGTLSGGSWLAGLPLANLQNRQVQKVARSADDATTSTQFVIDLGSARAIGVLALAAHNISAVGLVRISGHSLNSWTAPTYTSGWLAAWPDNISLRSLLEWEDNEFWLANYSQELLTGYRAPFLHILPAANVLRYWKVEIDDTANPDTFVQIGRLFLGPAWQPDVNYIYGAELVYEDPTPVETSLSGAEFFDERPRARVFRCTLGGLDEAEAYSGVMEMQRAAGISGEVLQVPDPADLTYTPMRAFIGRLRRLAPVAHTQITQLTATVEIKESI